MRVLTHILVLRVLAMALLLAGGLVAPYTAQPTIAQSVTIGCKNGRGDVPALIAAIVAANETAAPDTIALGYCAYTLSDPSEDDPLTGLPPITAPLTIVGNRAIINRSSNYPFRLIKTTAPLTLTALSLQSGRLELGSGPNLGLHSGGAIWNLGTSTLTLSDVELDANWAHTGGAISSGGPVVISGAQIHHNNAAGGCGGAIYSDGGSVTVRGSGFYLNESKGAGGAICVEDAPVTVERASFSWNRAEGEGSALTVRGPLSLEGSYLANNSFGTSVVSVRGSASIQRNRFVENTFQRSALALDGAGGPSRIANNLWLRNAGLNVVPRLLCLHCNSGTGDVTVEHETLLGDPAHDAIRVGGGGVVVRNSIFSGFVRAVSAMSEGRLTTRRNVYFPAGVQHEAGVADSREHIVADPQFVSPDDWDFRLLPGSPARDAAIDSSPGLDLAGLPRPLGEAPDVGAYEYDSGDFLPGPALSVPCSPDRNQRLIAAVEQANATPGADRIVLAPGCVFSFVEPHAAGEALPTVREWLAIDGNGATLRHDPASTLPLRLLASDAPLTLRDLTLEGARVAGYTGGAMLLHTFAHLYGENLLIRDSTAGSGSAIFAWGGTVELQGGLFERNIALGQGQEHGSGGAIAMVKGRLVLRGTRFVANSGTGEGGALALDGTTLDIEGARFEGNKAPVGSAIAARSLRSGRIVNSLWLDGPDASDGSVAMFSARGGLLFAHNTMVGSVRAGTRALELQNGEVNLAPDAAEPAQTGSRAVQVLNNIVVGHPGGFSVGTGLVVDMRRNLFYRSQPNGIEQVGGDPGFVAPARGDYRLLDGSPAINVGLALDNLAADHHGVPRPQGVAPDLGAFEFTAQNLPPVAADDPTYTTSPGIPLRVPAEQGVLANDQDPNGDPLSAMLHEVLTPDAGQIVLSPDGAFSYTPAPGFSGSFRFRYRAGDNAHFSEPATVTVRVDAGDPAPGRYRVALPLVRR